MSGPCYFKKVTIVRIGAKSLPVFCCSSFYLEIFSSLFQQCGSCKAVLEKIGCQRSKFKELFRKTMEHFTNICFAWRNEPYKKWIFGHIIACQFIIWDLSISFEPLSYCGMYVGQEQKRFDPCLFMTHNRTSSGKFIASRIVSVVSVGRLATFIITIECLSPFSSSLNDVVPLVSILWWSHARFTLKQRWDWLASDCFRFQKTVESAVVLWLQKKRWWSIKRTLPLRIQCWVAAQKNFSVANFLDSPRLDELLNQIREPWETKIQRVLLEFFSTHYYCTYTA